MIVKQIQRNVVQSHDFKSEIASIDVAEMRYVSSLLRNNYSNPILATVREIIANAVDANRGDQAVVVTAPTRFDQTFKVRDFGAGLSEEDLFGLYTKYGRSTKRDENLSIGGFGIGRFAPLSYTDAFTVTSIHGGEKTVVSVFVDEHGDTRFTKLHGSTTNEPSGVEIEVAVKDSDISAFESSIKKVARFLSQKIEYRNVEVKAVEWAIKNESWGIVSDRSVSGCCAVMGGIAYPVTNIDFSSHLSPERHPNICKILESNSRDLFSMNLVMFLPIGSVQLHHSREQLEYNSTTKRVLLTTLESIFSELKTSIQSKLDAKKTVSEFFTEMQLIFSDRYSISSLVAADPFFFTAADGSKHPVSYLDRFQNKYSWRRKNGGAFMRRLKQSVSVSPCDYVMRAASEERMLTLIVDDVNGRLIPSRIDSFAVANLDATTVVTISDEEAQKFLFSFMNDNERKFFVKASSIVPFKKKKNADLALRIAYDHNSYNSGSFISSDKAMAPSDEPFYFVYVANNTTSLSFYPKQDLTRGQFRDVVHLVNNFLDDADQVKRVFIMKSGVELPANAVSLDEYFCKKIKETFEKNSTYFKVKQKASLYRSEMGHSQRLVELAAKLPADHIISVFARNSTEDMKSSNLKPSEQRKQQQLMSFLNGIGVDWANNNVFCVTANSEANAERKKVVNEIDAKYPMLSVVRENWTWNGENLDKTLQYILFVDKHS
jgi:hypothetical protein